MTVGQNLGTDRDTASITVVVALLNSVSTVERCIDSVAAQTHGGTELVVVDGGSTDGTLDALRRNEHKIAYWESKPDRGVYHAWNKALRHATGDWILFLGSDDYLSAPDVFERAAPHLESARALGRVRVVYGSGALVGRNGDVLEVRGEEWESARRALGEGLPMLHGATLHHREIFEDHGEFDECFRICGDYDLLLRELLRGEARFMPDVRVVDMVVGGLSSEPANSLLIWRETVRARRRNGLRPLTPRLLGRLPKAVAGYLLYRLVQPSRADSLVDGYRAATARARMWTPRDRHIGGRRGSAQ